MFLNLFNILRLNKKIAHRLWTPLKEVAFKTDPDSREKHYKKC